ncbi:unnamed protein product [Cunninghamella echinulata]
MAKKNKEDKNSSNDEIKLSALMDPKNLPLLHSFDDQIKNKQDPQPSSVTFDSHPRVAIFGNNVLPPVKSKSIFELMWIAFKDKTLILLTVAAAVSLAVGLYEDIAQPERDAQGNKLPGVKWVEGVAIIVAICIVVLVGSVNDFQKEKQFRKLNAKKEDREVKCTRDGVIKMISVHDVLVGDILHLEPGDIVSTDGIFIEGHNLKCDESAATGESDAVRKQPWETCYKLMQPSTNDSALDNNNSSNNEKKPQHESKSTPDPFILSGSKVIEGVCTYLVTGVGIHSYNGRTMMALRTEAQTTPLQEKLNGLAEMIAKLGSAAGLIMLVAVLIRYFVGWKTHPIPAGTEIVADIMNILIVVVTIVVVAVPEGLPLAVTLALAYATQRMLKDNNLVRVLAACETMGNATTVCSDKTGTLTQNKMTVVAGTFGASLRFTKDVPENRKDLIDIKEVQKAPAPVLNLVNESIAINSTAFEGTDENGNLCFVGNKTETALLQFSQDIGAPHFDSLRTKYPVEQVFPFSSLRKAMATIVRVPHPSVPNKIIYRAYVKGASEILMSYCNQLVSLKSSEYQNDQQSVVTRAISSDDVNRVNRIIQSYASKSLRTIGIAYRDFEHWPPYQHQSSSSKTINEDGDVIIDSKNADANAEESDAGEEIEVPFDDLIQDKGLIMIGVVGIEDPLRPGVKEAVKACQQAGVFIRMVTGDNMITAKSIAKQCGIYTSGGVVMEGPVFRNLPPSEMDAILPRLQVLARSSPEDKQILVSRLQELGDIVAVTGDGTNDGPALKMADVGFSMGIAGTEVAKEASSIILMDDNFSSIVKAIMWGRCVNDAVKKFLEFQLTVNVTAVVLTFISAVASENHKSVLTAVQLLWVNLIMDTFAALALATDPPTEELLHRSPEPRSSPLITFKMWKMIIGQAIFQIVVTLVLLYSNVLPYDTESVELQTIVFNTFVFCQIFNEINCRRIDSKLNVFYNIFANKFFMFIFALCIFLQAIIVNFGGAAFQVTRVNGEAWAISLCIGLLALPVGVVVRLIPDEIFGFIFRDPLTRQRYLGTESNKATLAPPTVYVTGNERVAWNQPNNTNAPMAQHSFDKLSEKSSSSLYSIPASLSTPPTYDNNNNNVEVMDATKK